MAEQLASPSHTRLYLIADEEDIVLIAKCSAFLQVIVISNNDSRITLDGLNEESSKIVPGSLESFSEGHLVVVLN